MFTDILIGIGLFMVSIPYSSFAEYTLHRWVMHRKVPVRIGKWRWEFSYPFHAHAEVHHQIFKADDSYHLKKEEDKWTIPMAWWNGPLLILIASSPFIIASFVSGMWYLWLPMSLGVGLYYGAYEYLHWCMHLPKARRLEMSEAFRRLNGHHLLHHRYMGTNNFNVVWPLADWIMGTLLRRAKVPFCQPTGLVVPNVQPLSPFGVTLPVP